MASRRQATAGALESALQELKRRPSVICGFVIGLTEDPKSGQLQCIAAPHGAVEEHAAGLAGVLRDMANELDPTERRVIEGQAERIAWLEGMLNLWRCPVHGEFDAGSAYDGSGHTFFGQPPCDLKCERVGKH